MRVQAYCWSSTRPDIHQTRHPPDQTSISTHTHTHTHSDGFRDYITGTITMGGPKIIVTLIYNPPLNDRRPRQEFDRNNMATINIIESSFSCLQEWLKTLNHG